MVSLDEELLAEYLGRHVAVHFAPAFVSPSCAAFEEGKLQDYSVSGILLEQERDHLLYIPAAAVRMVQIKPRPTLWERLTGT